MSLIGSVFTFVEPPPLHEQHIRFPTVVRRVLFECVMRLVSVRFNTMSHEITLPRSGINAPSHPTMT